MPYMGRLMQKITYEYVVQFRPDESTRVKRNLVIGDYRRPGKKENLIASGGNLTVISFSPNNCPRSM